MTEPFHLHQDFPSTFSDLARLIPKATLDIFKAAMESLLPTPAKSHYLFNLRDFARVVQGCTLVFPETCKEPVVMEKLWVHEAFRFVLLFLYVLREREID